MKPVILPHVVERAEASLSYVYAMSDVRHFFSTKFSYIPQVGEIVDIFNFKAT